MTGKEIERKFLVSGDAWRKGAQGTFYRQGYLVASDDRAVRVRVA
ncbi:MAG: adenylate cyclase, partial [Deltaproteobacteria bacterium HGW-Deltaproteobacteria-9]